MGGKKKQKEMPDFVNTSEDPEQLKEKANKAYALAKQTDDVNLYNIALIHLNKAIDLTKEKPNHIYYSNRSLVLLDLGKIEPCLEDCNMVIKMKPDFVKVYWRKAKINQVHHKYAEAMAAIQEGYAIDPENAQLKSLEKHVLHEMEYSKIMPFDDTERINLEALYVWLDMGGANFNKCHLRTTQSIADSAFVGDGNRGVETNADVAAGEFVLMVPEKFVIGVNRAAQTKLAKEMTTHKIREAIVGESIQVIQSSVIAGYLLQIKKDKVPEWVHYLDTLPKKADHFPELYSEADLKWLDGSCTQAKYQREKAFLQGHHQIFTDLCPEFTFTFEEYAWAMKTIQSRIQQVRTPDNKAFLCLVPGVDMINHSLTPNCQLQYCEKSQEFRILAIEHIPAYEQLTMNYGDHANSDYLLHWGFTLPNNQKTVVQLPTWLDEKDAQFEEKKKLVDDQTKHDFLCPGGFSTAFNPALSRMRFYATKDLSWIEAWKNKFFNEWEQDQLRETNQNTAQILDGYGSWGGGNSKPKPKYSAINIVTPHSIENELEAWEQVNKFCEAAMKKYPTTFEEDVALLKKDDAEKNLTYNQRNCLVIRHSEKMILNFLMEGQKLVKKWAAMKASEAQPKMKEALMGGQAALDMTPIELEMRGYLATCIVHQMPKEEAVAQN